VKKIKTSELIIFLILIGFLVYLPSLFGRFVWDDEEQIVNNILVHSAKNIPLFFKGSTFNTGGTGNLNGVYYRPLMMVLFSFIYQIFGSQAFFFHFVQIALHISVVIVLFLIFKKFFKKKIAFILSLIFLVHPANVESVSYISAIQENLFVLFGLLSLYISIKKHNNKLFFMSLFFRKSFFSHRKIFLIF